MPNARVGLHADPRYAGLTLRTLVDALSDFAILLLGPDGTIVSWSTGAENINGYRDDEIVGSPFSRLFTADDVENGLPEQFLAAAAERGRFEHEGLRIRKNGETYWADTVLTPIMEDRTRLIGFACICRNITIQHDSALALQKAQETVRQTREQLFQAQKLEAVGQLTGGIAHDLNNILTVILGNADLLRTQFGDQTPMGHSASLIVQAAERGASLTRSLLAFARRQPLEPAPINVNALVEETDAMLRHVLGEQIEIATVLRARTQSAFVDPAQLQSALINLALNARDAMPNGGRLTIETLDAVLDQDYVDINPDAAAGDYIMLAVSDSGSGMSPEVLHRIYDPFFTTKPNGTGLGLSMVHGYVKQSGGHLKFYSEVGVGTTAKLYLPVADQAAVETSGLPMRGALAGGSETILVVEDDALVRTNVVSQLRGLGYRAIHADNGEKALQALAHERHVDLLFTDIIMPGRMNGAALAKEVRSRRPGIAVLYTSGYTEDAIVHQGRLDPGVRLLQKPYRLADLALMVRAALDDSP